MSLQQQIIEACASMTPLSIRGGDSKSFLGNPVSGQSLSTAEHRGVINYQPAELIMTARSGTPLHEIKEILMNQHQQLAFEPPSYGDKATIGGTFACGLSGPSRPWKGSARDAVLGCTIINGRGEQLHFGGEVIKNVAGYDASRLMVGAFGTLGVIMDISFRVVPVPAAQTTLSFSATASQAVTNVVSWSQQPLPITAAAWHDGELSVRLSGAAAAVRAARLQLGGEVSRSGDFWQQLREQQLAFFQTDKPLWRLSLPMAANQLEIPAEQLIEWGGAQRWLTTDAQPQAIRQAAAAAGGHATCYRNAQGVERFTPLPKPMLALQQRLKQAFDPKGILNPGRIYPEL
ncbi:MAG: glycolate oxidase subunit GlcE [Pseudomonadota bacterium]